MENSVHFATGIHDFSGYGYRGQAVTKRDEQGAGTQQIEHGLRIAHNGAKQAV